MNEYYLDEFDQPTTGLSNPSPGLNLADHFFDDCSKKAHVAAHIKTFLTVNGSAFFEQEQKPMVKFKEFEIYEEVGNPIAPFPNRNKTGSKNISHFYLLFTYILF